jgi:hypothetical protein
MPLLVKGERSTVELAAPLQQLMMSQVSQTNS